VRGGAYLPDRSVHDAVVLIRHSGRVVDPSISEFVVVHPVVLPDDNDIVVSFLSGHEWPFHGVSRLSPDAAAAVPVAADDVASFWIRDRDQVVGLIRLFDLDDVDNGSALFDLRIATEHRGRGIGRFAVDWLTAHLFQTYPGLHRIEATTRSDNAAMQAVFARCSYRQEGRMVEAWKNADGSRSDTLIYATLRQEFTARSSG
jgi:RimJ/RimL family protein N-acetyltransferase